jgi:homocysteine S-methyltransferase
MKALVTDGGLETSLIFHHGVDLPHFAAFPLLADPAGRALLEEYFGGYAAIAAAAGAGLILESATWRANPDWAAKLGYSGERLAEVNRDAIAMLLTLRERYRATVPEIAVGGMVGPRGDGYQANQIMVPEQAADYHTAQIAAFAQAGAELVTAYTLTHPGEAAGVVLAARAAGLPVAVSFTVETDGRLPDGSSLGEAVRLTDELASPDYFLVNCAHPTHIERGLGEPAPWQDRIRGLRPNASTRSHAELDEAEELDDGDPAELATDHQRLAARLPGLEIVGGCCGTDARHVAAMWGVSDH